MKIMKYCLCLIGIVTISLLTACTMTKERRLKEAEGVAIQSFGLKQVLVSDAGTSESQFMLESTKRYPFYILGLNELSEEVFVMVPALKSQAAYLIDWPFNQAFGAIVKSINEHLSLSNQDIKFADSLEIIKDFSSEIDTNKLDFNFMIIVKDQGIVQIDGNLVVYRRG